jgi:hypothetical protein
MSEGVSAADLAMKEIIKQWRRNLRRLHFQTKTWRGGDRTQSIIDVLANRASLEMFMIKKFIFGGSVRNKLLRGGK